MKNTGFMCVLFIFFICLPLSGQSQNSFSLAVEPSGSIPLGSSSDVVSAGFCTELSGSFIPGFLKVLGFQAGGSYLSLPLNASDVNNYIWTLSGFAGPEVRVPLGRRLSIYGNYKAGWYYRNTGKWEAEEFSGGGFYTGGEAGALFRISGPFTLGAGVSFDYYSELYNGLGISLSARLDFPGLKEEKGTLEIDHIKLLPLFPVLYSYYSDNTVGSVVVRNTGKESIENINIEFFMDRYMDNPMGLSSVFELGPGEERVIDLYALFTEDLMEITEGTKVSAGITLLYPGKTKSFVHEYSTPVDFYNRNAMRWDDDRKIASFVTAKDPEILKYAKNLVSWMQEVENPSLDGNLQKGIALFEGIRSGGIRYEIDPTTPFAEFSENAAAIDFLQFPRQTLGFTNGDCDDLTALYTSLLEAVGVESAFITVPGHIFAAFALETSPGEVRHMFSEPENLIVIDDKVWLPVEITLFQESFEQAWFTGAKEWREHSTAGQAILYPVRDAWEIYKAVGFRETGGEIELPDKHRVQEEVSTSFSKHIEREIYPQIKILEERLSTGRNTVRTLDRLALIHARYGLYDQAVEYYKRILDERDYPPALTNMGNIHFLWENYGTALDFFDRALKLEPENTSALVGSAKCNYEMENYGFVKRTMARVRSIEPETAERFAYLELKGDDSVRASDLLRMRKTVLWEDDEE